MDVVQSYHNTSTYNELNSFTQERRHWRRHHLLL